MIADDGVEHPFSRSGLREKKKKTFGKCLTSYMAPDKFQSYPFIVRKVSPFRRQVDNDGCEPGAHNRTARDDQHGVAAPRQTHPLLRPPPYLCGCILITAAALKGLDAATNPLAGGLLFGSRWELLAVIEVELLLGLALLLGLYPAAVRWLAIGCFALFAGVNFQQLLAGVSSCGCFGPVRVHPAYSLALDLLALAVLGWWRPAATAPRPGAHVIGLALGGLALLALGAGSPSIAQPEDLDSPGGVAVLDPREWVGQPFPLLDRLSGTANLRQGEWVVLFHRRGCSACAAMLDELHLLTMAPGFRKPVRLAFIEIPSDEVAVAESAARCNRLHLRARREWATKAPTCVRLFDGRTEAVTSDLEEVREWFPR